MVRCIPAPMKVKVVTVGKPKREWIKAGVAHYLDRLPSHVRLNIDDVPDSNPATEGEALLAKTNPDTTVIPLSEEGKQMSSEELAKKLSDPSTNVVFLIGGPDGLSDEAKASGTLLSLSKMTFPHELTLILLMEQIYRAAMINTGRSYHR